MNIEVEDLFLNIQNLLAGFLFGLERERSSTRNKISGTMDKYPTKQTFTAIFRRARNESKPLISEKITFKDVQKSAFLKYQKINNFVFFTFQKI